MSGNVNCGVCEASVEETLEHFLCDCKWYDVVRLEHGMMGVGLRNQLYGVGAGWSRGQCRFFGADVE